MTEEYKNKVKKYCENIAKNWIDGKYNQSFVIIGIDRNGFLKSIETKVSIMEDIKEE